MSPVRKWSLFIGYWGGVAARVHIAFAISILGIAALVYHGLHQKEAADAGNIAFLAAIIHVASVVVHVAAHATTARRCGTQFTQLTLGPWGELDPLELPRNHDHALHILLAGFFANVIVALCGVVGAMQFEAFKADDLLHLLDRDRLLSGSTPLVTCKLTILINLLLAGLNSIPLFPFDAASVVLRVGHWVDPQSDRERWQRVTMLAGRLVGLCCLVLAVFLSTNVSQQIFAPTYFLATLGLIFLFSPAELDGTTANFPEGTRVTTNIPLNGPRPVVTRSEAAGAGPNDGLSTALRRLAEATAVVTPEEQARIDDERMDHILAKLHERGMAALSPDEQETLKRVSQRYKNKRFGKST